MLGLLYQMIKGIIVRRQMGKSINEVLASGFSPEAYQNTLEMFTAQVRQGETKGWFNPKSEEEGKEMIFIPAGDRNEHLVTVVNNLIWAIVNEVNLAAGNTGATTKMPNSAFDRVQELLLAHKRKIGWSEIAEYAVRIPPEEVGLIANRIVVEAAKGLGLEIENTDSCGDPATV